MYRPPSRVALYQRAGRVGPGPLRGKRYFVGGAPDPEFKEEFVRRYAAGAKRRRSPSDDIDAASRLTALSFYPDEDVFALLKKSLEDGRHFEIVLRKSNEIRAPGETIRLYAVRQAAYEALVAMGEKVAKPKHVCEYFTIHVSDGISSGWGMRDPKTALYLNFDMPKTVGND